MWSTQNRSQLVGGSLIPLPYALHLLTQQLCSVPRLCPRNEKVSGRHTWPQWQWPASHQRSLLESTYNTKGKEWACGKAEKGERSSANPFTATCFNHLQHSQCYTSSGTPGGTCKSGVPQEKSQFYHWLSASAGAKSLKSSDPASSICESWGKACLPLSAVE